MSNFSGSAARSERLKRLVWAAVERLELDLSNLTVLTEAATGHYAVTPAIAAAAGASVVHAVARDSVYGTAKEAASACVELASRVGVRHAPNVITGLPPEIIARCDVIMNLGFVRPINRAMIASMKPHTVVALMCEDWEWRPEDVDLLACRDSGIAVVGTNETHPAVDVFERCGAVAVQLLLDAGVEIYRSSIAIVGRDKFAPVLARWLRSLHAEVGVYGEFQSEEARRALKCADALLVADYGADCVIGEGGLITPQYLAREAPHVLVVQFAGGVDAKGLAAHGIAMFPGTMVPARRMSRTLAAVGARPVIDLHAGGLKAAELALRAASNGSQSNADTLVFQEVPIGVFV